MRYCPVATRSRQPRAIRPRPFASALFWFDPPHDVTDRPLLGRRFSLSGGSMRISSLAAARLLFSIALALPVVSHAAEHALTLSQALALAPPVVSHAAE